MSYWAATVITTLLSVLPDGDELLLVLWGSFTLDSTTLTRFYSFHYLATLLSAAVAVLHLIALHVLGSTASYWAHDTADTLPFSRYYLIKDAVLFALVALLYIDVLYTEPTLFSDVELAISVNTMATPPHIVPEWYLLAYYATLRGIPSKALGILMVVATLALLAMGALPSLVHE